MYPETRANALRRLQALQSLEARLEFRDFKILDFTRFDHGCLARIFLCGACLDTYPLAAPSLLLRVSELSRIARHVHE